MDGHRQYPVDLLVMHHAVSDDMYNWSDIEVSDWFNRIGRGRGYAGVAHSYHVDPYTGQETFSQAHYCLHKYTADGNKYGWRMTMLIADPFNNVAWHAGNWPVNQRSIGVETAGNFVDQRLDEKALMLVADTFRDWDVSIGGVLDIAPHRAFSATACPGQIADQIDTLIDMINNKPTWDAKLWPNTQPQPTPQPSGDLIFHTVRHGGWRSQVITEIIETGMWSGQWEDHLAKFNELNPTTPPGGWKPGDQVVIGVKEIPQPTPQPIPEPPKPVYKVMKDNVVIFEGTNKAEAGDKYRASVESLKNANQGGLVKMFEDAKLILSEEVKMTDITLFNVYVDDNLIAKSESKEQSIKDFTFYKSILKPGKVLTLREVKNGVETLLERYLQPVLPGEIEINSPYVKAGKDVSRALGYSSSTGLFVGAIVTLLVYWRPELASDTNSAMVLGAIITLLTPIVNLILLFGKRVYEKLESKL